MCSDGELAEKAALLRECRTKSCALEIQQELLGGESTPKARKRAIGGDYAMAGNDDGNGIVMICLSHGTRRQWRANLCGKLGVRPRLAEGYTQEPLPATQMKGGPAQIERKVELLALSREILIQLAGHYPQPLGLLDPARILRPVGSRPASLKGNHGKPFLAHGEIQVADRRVVTGGEEKFGWLGK